MACLIAQRGMKKIDCRDLHCISTFMGVNVHLITVPSLKADCMIVAVACLLHLANSCFSNVSNRKVGYSTAKQYECSGSRGANSSAAMTT